MNLFEAIFSVKSIRHFQKRKAGLGGDIRPIEVCKRASYVD